MKKRIIAIFLLASMLFAGIACDSTTEPEGSSEAPAIDVTEAGVTDPAEETTQADETTQSEETTAEVTAEPNILDNSKTYNILFIGNSYTHYNDMPEQIFSKVISSAGYKANVTRITKGSWYLLYHADENNSGTGAKVDEALKKNKYDFVVIQEQSTAPILEPEKFYTGARNLVAKIRANGATPIFYGTWGRKVGHKVLTENNWTNESMTWMLAAAYDAIGKELGVDVAQVGFSFFDVYTNNKKINLYNGDLTHPSAAGSYLAALTIFAKMTGMDPTKVAYNGTLNEENAAIVKEAARKAVFETPEIPEQYRTKSEGLEFVEENYGVDYSAMKNLTSFPTAPLISLLKGGTYPNGKSFSGILGTKGAVASTEYSTSGLTDAQKADIADIGYGVSVIGIEKMDSSSKGYTTAVENLVNGHWGTSYMACFHFDDNKYNINGEEDEGGIYTGLITLNFGSKHKFEAMGFSSGSLEGFPGVAEVFVSDDGINWTRVPTACWNNVNGTALVNCGTTPADPYASNTAKVTCLFSMEGVSGQYIRIGVVVGRNDAESKYNTINTREILVYGEKLG